MEAEQQYQLALKTKPDYLPAILGYAQLQEQLEKQDEAIRLYQRRPNSIREAAVYNNWACATPVSVGSTRRSASWHRPSSCTKILDTATISPRCWSTRAGSAEAFAHLKEAHGEAAAYYNLGYLLNKRGQTQAAMQHFSQAIRVDPSMTPATMAELFAAIDGGAIRESFRGPRREGCRRTGAG